MQTSKTGLWYNIYVHGSGKPALPEKEATIKYNLYLLDGTLCYSSDELGVKKFRIGKGSVESGLDEGVSMLKVGDKARFILPPHLAFGLLGDEKKIPKRSIILYDVELINITD
jgi:FKBP-type peptidyl-prolyl cis-trans isomerase FkpA